MYLTMADTQNSTGDITVVSDTKYRVEALKAVLRERQQQYIDYCAVGGLITTEDGELKRMTVTQFAANIGYERTSLYLWQKTIPDFWERVNKRRKEIGGGGRVQKVYNGLYLKGAAGNPQAAAMFLANHDENFRMPNQRVEVEVKHSYADLLAVAVSDGVMEGEVIERKSDTGTSSQDMPAHTPAP